MENKHKFKPFDKILVRDSNDRWKVDLYSYFDNKYNIHHTMCYPIYKIPHNEILPFEGNEHLLGTKDEPEEEVELEEGDFCFFAYNADAPNSYWFFGHLTGLEKELFRTIGRQTAFAIPFKDFNPYDMEETRKHILCVKNGKIIKYKE